MPRKRFSAKQVRKIIARQGGLCATCGAAFDLDRGDRVEIDHAVPVALDGSNEAENVQALCPGCHREKTRGDITRIAKAKRVAAKHDGTYRPARHPVPGSRRTRLKKALNGAVIDRATGAVLRPGRTPPAKED